MPDNNIEQQPNYPLQPDLTPVKKESLAKVWFKNLTPKKKWLVFGVLGVAVIAAVIIIYLSLAAGELAFYFSLRGSVSNVSALKLNVLPGSGSGETISINLRPDKDKTDNITYFEMTINYNDTIFNGDASQEQSSIIITEVYDNVSCDDLDTSVNVIKCYAISGFALPLAGNEDGVVIAEIDLSIPFNAQAGRSFNLIFGSGGSQGRSGSAGNQVTYSSGSSGGLTVYPVLYDAFFTVSLASDANGIYLSPAQNTKGIGESFNVNVLLKSELDIVAVGAVIDYDPQYLELTVLDSPVFPVTGQESHDRTQGIITLVRGTYGNASLGDGNVTPQTTKQGFRGKDGILATLEVRGIDTTEPNWADITISDAKFIQDNGEGTEVQNVGAVNGSYQITEEQPLPQTPFIFNESYSCIQVGENKYNLTVMWETNVDATSVLTVNNNEKKLDGLRKKHGLTAQNMSETGTYQISGVTFDNKTFSSDRAISYDCAYEIGPLEIRDLVVTPSDESAQVVFMTVGGPNQGRATGGVDQFRTEPTSTQNTNIHRFKISGLSSNTRYTLTAVADAGSDHAEKTTTFVTLADLGVKPTNVVLKVNRDRICDNWLYCQSAVQVTNTKGKVENLCFDLGLCERVDQNGNCISPVELGQQGITGGNQTFMSPYLAYSTANVDNKESDAAVAENKIKNLSGLSKVGLNWGVCSGNETISCDTNSDCNEAGVCEIIQGYKHYAVMSSLGKSVNIPNGNFELGDVWPWQANDIGQISVISDIYSKGNKVLQIAVDNNLLTNNREYYAGARVPLGELSESTQYVISFDARSQSQTGKKIRAQVRTWDTSREIWVYSDLFSGEGYPILIGQGFARFAKKIDRTLPTGYSELLINQTTFDNSGVALEEFRKPFYIDNVSMQPVLHVQNRVAEANNIIVDDRFIARSCRMYPSSNAPECTYTDSVGGKYYSGWKGFCVENDPGYSDMCLNWWPVDIISGETDIFGSDPQVGYKNRKPLYYCLESAGNYPFERELEFSGAKDGSGNFTALTSILHRLGFGGWSGASGIYNLSALKYQLNKVEIDKLVLTPLCEEGGVDVNCFSKKDKAEPIVLNRNNNWSGYLLTSGHISPEPQDWDQMNDYLGGGCVNQEDLPDDFFAIHAIFDDYNNFFGFEAGLCNKGGATGFVRYKVDVYLREPCNVIAQVVDPYAKNFAWSSRILANGWNENNYLGYKYNQDYPPYGASVPPEPVNHPEEWSEPLYVMPADKTNFYQAPYQARAGSPYAVDTMLDRTCISGNNISARCNQDSDCGNGGQCEVTVGSFSKVMGTTCISGSDDNLGKSCSSNTDCGYGLSNQSGVCMGIELNDEQKKVIVGDYNKGIKNLSQLFAKGLGVWVWYPRENRYLKVCSADIASDIDCQGDAKCEDLKNACWEVTNIGQKPEVKNITINGRAGDESKPSDVHLYGGSGGVALKFNALVNENQLPLVAYRVDWRDGQGADRVNITEVTNLSIAPRTSPASPHIMLHTYECSGSSACEFVPRVQIEDNWGIKSEWTEFGGRVIVEP